MTFKGKDITIGAVFSALGVVFPILFHFIGLGSIFLPMFIPIATAGFLISIPVAFSVGLITPLFSAVVTGMPPFFPPIAPIMSIELSILAGIISIFYRKFKWNVWICLVISLILSRTIYLFAILLVVPILKLPSGILTVTALISSIPGVILIIAVVPVAVKIIEKKYISFSET